MGSEREKLIVQKIYSRDPVWIQSINFDRYFVYWNDELKWVWMDDLFDFTEVDLPVEMIGNFYPNCH